MKETPLPPRDSRFIWRFASTELDLSQQGILMGVLNLTPDSFSDGGFHPTVEAAVSRALDLVSEGAGILDLGGESTRPGSAPVSLSEELRRVLPVLEALRPRTRALISIDTTKSEVARQALALGADIINDISALQADPAMLPTVASSECGIVLMHMQGTPRTMQDAPAYGDVTREVCSFLEGQLDAAVQAGIAPERIVLDPGLGFGKTLQHNLSLLQNLSRCTALPRPILLGVSRKSFLAPFCTPPGAPQSSSPADRHWPGVAITSLGRERGARIFRVHEPRDHLHALRMTEAILATPS